MSARGDAWRGDDWRGDAWRGDGCFAPDDVLATPGSFRARNGPFGAALLAPEAEAWGLVRAELGGFASVDASDDDATATGASGAGNSSPGPSEVDASFRAPGGPFRKSGARGGPRFVGGPPVAKGVTEAVPTSSDAAIGSDASS